MSRGIVSTRLHLVLTGGIYKKYPKKYLLQSSEFRRAPMLIKSGFVKRYMIANDGTLGIQAIYGPNNIFPLTWLFKTLFDQEIYTGPEVIYYETMTTCEIYSINTEEVLERFRKEPILYQELLKLSGTRFNSHNQRAENLTLPSSYHRVAHQLLFFAEEFGEKAKGGIQICLPLTQQDIADILSATRETVSINISKLRKKGLIKINQFIVVPDLEKLRAEAYS